MVRPAISMEISMTDTMKSLGTSAPLRRRMIEDMDLAGLSPRTQLSYLFIRFGALPRVTSGRRTF